MKKSKGKRKIERQTEMKNEKWNVACRKRKKEKKEMQNEECMRRKMKNSFVRMAI